MSNLYEELLPFCRAQSSEGWTRGRKTLFEALQLLTSLDPIIGNGCEPLEIPAKAVDPDRVSLPVKAAVCRPEKYMCAERQKVLAELSKIILPESLWPSSLPRPCRWISRPDETKLRSLLLAWSGRGST